MGPIFRTTRRVSLVRAYLFRSLNRVARLRLTKLRKRSELVNGVECDPTETRQHGPENLASSEATLSTELRTRVQVMLLRRSLIRWTIHGVFLVLVKDLNVAVVISLPSLEDWTPVIVPEIE